jgi:3-oxoacyl-[acyl-carrier-protein] synthase-3
MATAYITGIGAFLPNEPVTNDQIENVLGVVNGRSSQVKEWVLNYNGIQTRHYAIDPATGNATHTNSQLTVQAIKNAAKAADFDLKRLQVLACGTSSADQIIPSHTAMVHGELKLKPCEIVSTTGVCCSGMGAMKYAYMSVLAGQSENAIAAGSELASVALRASKFRTRMEQKKLEDFETEPMLAFENEFLRWMLSDGSGAVVIQDTPRDDALSLRIDWIDLVSFANEAETCMYYGGKKLKDGSLVGMNVIDDPMELCRDGYLNLAQDVRILRDRLPKYCRIACVRARDRHGLHPDQIDWILPHYSSEGFRQPFYDGMVAEGFTVPYDRWFTNLRWKGNTGSASIYIILEELLSSGRAKQGDRILCMIPESARFTFSVMHLTAF